MLICIVVVLLASPTLCLNLVHVSFTSCLSLPVHLNVNPDHLCSSQTFCDPGFYLSFRHKLELAVSDFSLDL